MERKTFVSQSLKGGILAFVLSTVFLLLLALIAKLFTMPVDILPIVNQVLKGVAVLLATIICVREDKKLWKALVVGLVFAVLNLILFVILGGEFNWTQVLLDLLISEVVAFVTAIALKAKSK